MPAEKPDNLSDAEWYAVNAQIDATLQHPKQAVMVARHYRYHVTDAMERGVSNVDAVDIVTNAYRELMALQEGELISDDDE
jgi:hypothetical protein